jgi:prepilin-type N-terminal cleavage/methylation domain-containing protein
MNASTKTSRNKESRGFTLVEMLVVIGMIAALAGVSFPVYKSIQRKVEKRQLQMLMGSVERAVDNFETEYTYLPYLPGNYPTTDQNFKSSEGKTAPIFTALVGLGDTCNFKKIKFLDASEPESGKAGLEINGEVADLIDPWGNGFQRIRLDYDNDGEVPWHYGSSVPDEGYAPVLKRIALISFGPDAKPGAWAGGTHTDNLHNFPVPNW